MRVINVPEELVVKAKQTLYLQDAVKAVIRELTKEIAKNHIEVTALWHEVHEEAVRQGLQKADDETYNFDYITNKFTVVKVKL